jgi:hypothetical protein
VSATRVTRARLGYGLRVGRLDGLPTEIKKKINKTKQTRGAQPYERVAYQNRVNRNGIAVVPYQFRDRLHPEGFENGYRVMVRPRDYFAEDGSVRDDFDSTVVIGDRAFIYYDNRAEWLRHPPRDDWEPCPNRTGAGHYLARVPGTTAAAGGEEVVLGEPQGIRFFEYASTTEIEQIVAQLAWLAWHTEGIEEATADTPSDELMTYLNERGLANVERLIELGAIVIDAETGEPATICPLCLERIKASNLMSRVVQAEGREVVDLTITEANLFHLRDLRPGEYNHQTYGLAWGHHHCNAVARDHGIVRTLEWMEGVLRRHGRLPTSIG